MKAFLISGLALGMLAGVSQAQAAPPTPPDAPPPWEMKAPPPPSKGAHFRLEDGDAAVDVKCADDEPMKACADITLQILDKMVSLPKAQ